MCTISWRPPRLAVAVGGLGRVGLAARGEAFGVTFRYGTPILGLEPRGGRIAAVRTAAGSLAADNFVVAQASYTPIVLRSVGIRVPIYPVKGVTITMPAAPWA